MQPLLAYQSVRDYPKRVLLQVFVVILYAKSRTFLLFVGSCQKVFGFRAVQSCFLGKVAKSFLVQSRTVLLLVGSSTECYWFRAGQSCFLWEGCQKAFGSERDSPAFCGKSLNAFWFRAGQSCFLWEVIKRLLVQSGTVLLFWGDCQMPLDSERASPAFCGKLPKGVWFSAGQSCSER